MSVQWQVVDVPLGIGTDQHTDSQLLDPGKLLVAQNVVITKARTLQKRFGLAAQTKTILNAGAGLNAGANLPTITTIASYKNAPVLASQDAIYTYSAAAGQSVYDDMLPQCMVEPRIHLASSPGTIGIPDMAVVGTVACIVWGRLQAGGTYWDTFYKCVDIATGTVLQPATAINVSQNISLIRVAAVGSTFVIFKSIKTAGTITATTVSASTFAVVTTATVVNDVTAAAVWDMSAMTDRVVLAYLSTAGPPGIKVKTFDTSIAQLQTVTLTDNPAAAPVAIAVQGTSAQAGEMIHVAYGFTNVTQITNVAQVDAATFGQVYAVVQMASLATAACGGAVTTLGLCYISGSQTAVITTYPDLVQCTDITNGVASADVRSAYHYALLGRPFLLGGRVYCALGDSSAQANANTFTVVDTLAHLTGLATNPTTMRPVANVATRYTSTLAINGTQATPCPYVSGTTVYMPAPMYQTADARGGIDLVTLNFQAVQPRLMREAGDGLAVSAGLPNFFDGTLATEFGFLHAPRIRSSANVAAIGGALSAGSYSYVAVYAWTDAQGQRHRSEPSAVATITAVLNDAGRLTIDTCSLTLKYDAENYRGTAVEIELYRTAVNGTTYYRLFATSCPSGLLNNATGARTISYDDLQADSAITSNPIVYSQGAGAPTGGVLVSQTPPAAKIVHVHANRVWLAGCDDARALYFSRAIVQSEAPAFHDTNVIRISDGDAITGLGSIDDKLIIFKKHSIYALVGDGPNDLGMQSDYSMPQRISADTGCSEPRSIVQMANGLMFQGVRGMYLLDRSLQLQYVGEGVEANLTTYPNIGAAIVQDEQMQVRFVAYATGTATGSYLIYDYLHGAWTNAVIAGGFSRAYGAANVNGVYTTATDDGALLFESKTTYLDSGNWVTIDIQTGTLRFGSVQGYKRIRKLALLLNSFTGHDLKIGIGFDQDNAAPVGTPDQQVTFSAATIAAMTSEQVEIRLSTQKLEGLQLRIRDLTPSSGSVGTGRSFSLKGMSFELGMKSGMAKLPAAQKG